MTIQRAAAALILASQLVLLVLVFDTTGASATLFSFVGAPLLGAGMLLAILSLRRRRQTERDADSGGANSEQAG